MKRFIFFLMIIVGMFSLVSLANAVECNADLSQGGNSCTVQEMRFPDSSNSYEFEISSSLTSGGYYEI